MQEGEEQRERELISSRLMLSTKLGCWRGRKSFGVEMVITTVHQMQLCRLCPRTPPAERVSGPKSTLMAKPRAWYTYVPEEREASS